MNKNKQCRTPRCKKEVHKEKTLFCLEHEREFQNFKKNAKNMGISLVLLVGAFIAKKYNDKS